MDELRKCIAAGELLKAADLMKAQLGLLEQQIADADRRLERLESSRADWRSFYETTFMAPGVASLHRAPRVMQ
jgi:hypothetical protein